MLDAIPRMSLQQRVQHGLFALFASGALATGLVLAGGAGPARGLHIASGFGALALLAYHLLYLGVRGYVESSGWSDFPLRWTGRDWTAAADEIRYVLGAAAGRPEADEYRVSQKALYWWTLAAGLALGATGIGVGYWESFGSLRLLPHLVALHGGLGSVSAAVVLWHLYGALTWEGCWWPEWSWLSGTLDAQKAQRKVPGAYRRHLAELAERETEGRPPGADERTRERHLQEKEEVQAELELGNRLALEERYVESLHHYRRALELYPGYSQALYNMARVLARMGERDMARETYRQFLDADPFHPLSRKAQEAIRELSESGGAP